MKKQKRYYYPAILTHESDQKIAVFFPDFDVATSGTDYFDAVRSAYECLETVIAGLKEDAEELPIPTPVSGIACSKNESIVIIRAEI